MAQVPITGGCSWKGSPWGSPRAKLLPSLPPRSPQGRVAAMESLLGWLVADPSAVVSDSVNSADTPAPASESRFLGGRLSPVALPKDALPSS